MKKITAWPVDERPREKLLVKGASSLSLAETLAIFLRTGVKGKSAIALARDLLERFGSLRGIYSASDDELQDVTGIGRAKIAQIRAVLELSKRYLEESFIHRAYIECSQDILKLLYHEMRDLDHEMFKMIMLNSVNKVLAVVDAFKGTLSSGAIYPREVVKLALKHSAAAVIFVHNHPSGKALPSAEDRRITRDLLTVCGSMDIKVHDHIIIGDNESFSFSDEGLMQQYALDLQKQSGTNAEILSEARL